MNNWLDKPWIIRLVSLVLAILIFIVISFDSQKNQADDVGFDLGDLLTSSEETKTLEDIPVNINIDDESYVVSGVPQTVTVTLEGSVSVVRTTATQENFDVYVDLENLEPGTYTVPLQYSGISDRLNVSIEPEEVEVTIEERAVEEFEVMVDFINQNQLGPEFELGEATVSPKTVTITSARSVVDKIAIVKAFVDVQGTDNPIDAEVPVKVYDSQGNELSVRIEPQSVDVSVEISSPSKDVPVEIKTKGDLNEGLQLNGITGDIEEVTVYAAEDVLANIEHIETEQIDLTELTEETTIEVPLIAPKDVRKLGKEKVSITIDVQQIEEKTITNVPIEIENLSDQFSVVFIAPTTNQMSITVRGIAEDIDNLSAEDFRLVINAEDYLEGVHEIPVEMEGPDTDTITTETETDEITVRIEES